MSDEITFPDLGLEPLEPAPGPELVFGIVAPVGARRDGLVQALIRDLGEYHYHTETIKLSDLIPMGQEKRVSTEPERTQYLMDAGDSIRERSGLGDALAILAITEIVSRREKLNLKDGEAGFRGRPYTSYILDSLKHPDEIHTLRAVYGSCFILISGYSRRDQRVQHFAEKVAISKCDAQRFEKYKCDAEKVVERDSDEEGRKFGQKLQSCFPLADYFVDLDDPVGQQRRIIERYLRILFGSPFETPNKDEVGMFHAEAASWRSADLARQVGASICTKDGAVLSVGCNEVPKAFGGLYWEEDENDGRDFQRGRNEGNELKRLIVAEIFGRMINDSRFETREKELFEKLKESVLVGEDDPIINNLQALNLIEYGRTVHAEMAALSDAALRGISVRGTTLFVNTFPCHLCARHIIAAGIERVVFIEPYPKSLTGKMFSDSVTVEAQGNVRDKVSFQAFTGVAPRSYRFAFRNHGSRKDKKGDPIRWTKSGATTKMKTFVTSYLARENQVIKVLAPRLIENREN